MADTELTYGFPLTPIVKEGVLLGIEATEETRARTDGVLTLPREVTAIAHHALYACACLETVTVEEGCELSEIGDFALAGCQHLCTFRAPDSLASIGDSAFLGCEALKSVSLGEGSRLTAIGDSAFAGCCQLTSFCLPHGVAAIPGGAFRGCRGMTEFRFAEGSRLTAIGDYAFLDCQSLEALLPPPTLTRIGTGAFLDCHAMARFPLGEESRLTAIGSAAFLRCESLAEIALPRTVGVIPANAFGHCKSLTAVTLPEDSLLTAIGDYAFLGCRALRSFPAPDTLTAVGASAFAECTALVSFPLGEGSRLATIGGAAFLHCDSLAEIRVPRDVTVIPSGAFSFCHSLMLSFAEGSRLTAIEDFAFLGCEEIYSAILPSTVKKLGKGAFSGCTSLAVLALGTGIEEIGTEAFSGCRSLTTVIFPASLRRLGTEAFYGCVSLQNVIFSRDSDLRILEENCFLRCDSIENLTIPLANVGLFRRLARCLERDVHLTLEAPTRPREKDACTVPEGAFAFCQGFNGLTLSESVTAVGPSAFRGCPELVSVEILGAEEIGERAFADCCILQTVSLAPTTRVIGPRAFCDCQRLQTAVMHESALTSIGKGAFLRCTVLEEALLPKTLTALGEEAFSDCCNLRRADLFGTKLTALPAGCFRGCRSLVELIPPEGLLAIGREAFLGCQRLVSLPLAHVEKIGDRAFLDCTVLEGLADTEKDTDAFCLPSALRSVGHEAFLGCRSLLTAVGGVQYVGHWAVGREEARPPAMDLQLYLKRERIRTLAARLASHLIEGDGEDVSVLHLREGAHPSLSELAMFSASEFLGKALHHGGLDGLDRITEVMERDKPVGAYRDSEIVAAVQNAMADATRNLVWDSLTLILRRRIEEGVTCPLEADTVAAIKRSLDLASMAANAKKAEEEGRGDAAPLMPLLFTEEEIGDAIRRAFYRTVHEEAETAAARLLPPLRAEILSRYEKELCYEVALWAERLNRHDGELTKPLPENEEPEEVNRAIRAIRAACEARIEKAILQECCEAARQGIRHVGTVVPLSLRADTVGVADSAFRGANTVILVALPPTVKHIGARAFLECSRITDLTLPEGLLTVGREAFSGCRALRTVTVPTTVTAIGEEAFFHCHALRTVNLPAAHFRHRRRRRFFDKVTRHSARFLLLRRR